jgi:hypothetical protein
MNPTSSKLSEPDPPACRAQLLDEDGRLVTCMAQSHNHPPHAAFFDGLSLPANQHVWVTISWHDED